MRPLNAVLRERGGCLTPRQRLAVRLCNSWGRHSETNYYIVLFERWMSIYGREIVWFGEPSEWDAIPRKHLNTHGDRAGTAYRKVESMIKHWQGQEAMRRHCYPSVEYPWIRGKRKYIELFDHHSPTLKPSVVRMMRAVESGAKIQKLVDKMQ